MLHSGGRTVLLSSSWQCQAQQGSAGRGFVARICAQGTWQRRRRCISKQCFELYTKGSLDRGMTPAGIKYGVAVPEA